MLLITTFVIAEATFLHICVSHCIQPSQRVRSAIYDNLLPLPPPPPSSPPLWPSLTASNRCSVLLQLDTVTLQARTHTHKHTRTLSPRTPATFLHRPGGRWWRKQAMWGPKSSAGVGLRPRGYVILISLDCFFAFLCSKVCVLLFLPLPHPVPPDITARVLDPVERLMGTEHGTTAPSMEMILGTEISQRQKFRTHNHTHTANGKMVIM